VGYKEKEFATILERLARQGKGPSQIDFNELMAERKKVAGDRPFLLEYGRKYRPLSPHLAANRPTRSLQQWHADWDGLSDEEKRAIRERTRIEATTPSGVLETFNLEQLIDKWPAVVDGSIRLNSIRADRVTISIRLADLYQHAAAVSESVVFVQEVDTSQLWIAQRILAALDQGRPTGQLSAGVRLEPMEENP